MHAASEDASPVRHMPSVRRNIAANIIGQGWTALLSIAFVPLYIRFMGMESYGLVGFFVTLQVLFSVLDLGLTATLSRELARLSAAGESSARQMRDVARTLEAVYWALAMLIVVVVALAADWIAGGWLNANQLPQDLVSTSVMLMGLAIAFRMPYGFYAGGMIGLQRQVLLNEMKIAVETFRIGGGVLALWLVAPTVTAFFVWHALASIAGAVFFRQLLWRCLPAADGQAHFRLELLRGLWRFGAGISAIAVLAMLLTELDKIILSKMLPLEDFGHYMLASTVAMGINLIIVPVVMAMQPRLTQLAASRDDAALRRLYHKGCQLMSVLVMPVALGLCFFSESLLRIWTQDAAIARHAAPVLSLLAGGTALNALMNIPYALQLAHGWTKLVLITTTVSVCVLVPSLVIMISNFGVLGAASIWAILNAGNVLVTLPIVHAKFMRGEHRHWLLTDFARPTLAALIVTGSGWMLMPSSIGFGWEAVWVLATVLGALLGAAVVTPATQTVLQRSQNV